MNKYILPISIIIGAIILGMFYYRVEIKKQEYALEQIKIQAEEESKIEEQKRLDEEESKVKELEIQKEQEINLKQSRAAKAEACVSKANQSAIANFYIECVNNPEIGGSDSKCITLDDEQTIRYIRYAKGISFRVFEIDKQLTADINTCTKLYGN